MFTINNIIYKPGNGKIEVYFDGEEQLRLTGPSLTLLHCTGSVADFLFPVGDELVGFLAEWHHGQSFFLNDVDFGTVGEQLAKYYRHGNVCETINGDEYICSDTNEYTHVVTKGAVTVTFSEERWVPPLSSEWVAVMEGCTSCDDGPGLNILKLDKISGADSLEGDERKALIKEFIRAQVQSTTDDVAHPHDVFHVWVGFPSTEVNAERAELRIGGEVVLNILTDQSLPDYIEGFPESKLHTKLSKCLASVMSELNLISWEIMVERPDWFSKVLICQHLVPEFHRESVPSDFPTKLSSEIQLVFKLSLGTGASNIWVMSLVNAYLASHVLINKDDLKAHVAGHFNRHNKRLPEESRLPTEKVISAMNNIIDLW